MTLSGPGPGTMQAEMIQVRWYLFLCSAPLLCYEIQVDDLAGQRHSQQKSTPNPQNVESLSRGMKN